LSEVFLSFYLEATRWLSWYGVGLASADRLPVVVRILLVQSEVSSATRRKATGADKKKSFHFIWRASSSKLGFFPSLVGRLLDLSAIGRPFCFLTVSFSVA